MDNHKIRVKENLHVAFWLLKDASWAANFKLGGILMIFPTFFLALYLTYQSRKNTDDLFHNIAVSIWISANSLWMIGEFFKLDEGKYGLRNVAVLIFIAGILILAYYYIFKRRYKQT